MSWVIISAGAVGIAVLFAAWWLWWWLPKRQVGRFPIDDAKARADVEDNFRNTIGQLLGGAALLIGAAAAFVQFREQHLQFTQQQETAREQLRVSVQQIDQQQRAAHDLLVSNQVAKGFEQLGSNQLVVRLGGVYALEGVMNTSEQYHQPVLEALSAFVRDSPRKPTGKGPPATDIQAVLTVLGRRKAIGPGRSDLANAHIPQADLSGAHLEGANLRGADLSGANLNGANLNGANLSEADLSGANLSEADLSGANLNVALLIDAFLRGADLSGANLNGAALTGPSLRQAQIQLDQACGTGTDLRGLPSGLTLKPCSTSPPGK
jgi:hypothetical protein